MKKNIWKLLTLVLVFSSFFFFSGFKSHAAASDITATLEQQEDSTNDKIRYICTIANVEDLDDISSITVNLFIYKYGSGSKTATDTIDTVYTSISGTNGKDSASNTYYAIYTLTELKTYYDDYTLSCSMTIVTSASSITTNEISYTIGDNTDTFYMGMDTSAVPALEAAGVVYRDDNGNVEDVFRVLADHGINFIRVRIWNDPYYTDANNVKYGYGGGNCDLANAIEIGKRANKYGMKLLVDFHYSDFWADPAKQKLPKAWEGYTDAQIETAIYDFTYNSLTEMKSAGIDVGMVQVGNETNDAMCGHSGDSTMEAICGFFSSGSRAVRAVYPSAKVAVHFANPSNYSTYEWYAAQLKTYSVDYDVFGTSYYPYWHGSLSNLSSLLSEIATTYSKEVCVLETAYANTEEYTDSRSDGYNNTVYTRTQEYSDDTNCSLPYEFSVNGQKNAILGLIDTIANKTTNGLGIFYWEGTWIKTPSSSASVSNSYVSDSETYGTGWGNKYAYYYDSVNYAENDTGGCAIENEAFFDENGNPFESLDVFMTDVSSTITRSTDGYAAATLCNASFEDKSLDGWTLSGLTDSTWPKTDEYSNGSYGLAFGSSSSYTIDLSQDISYITYGTYTFSMDVMGDNCTDTMYVYVTVNGVQTKTTAKMTAWDTWKTYSVSFTADLDDTVVVGFYISTSNIWGYVDNAVLTRTDSSSSSSTSTEVIATNTLENADFEEGSSTGWTLTDNGSLNTKTVKSIGGENNSTYGYSFWDEDALNFTVSQDISGNQGEVAFSMEICGGPDTNYTIYTYVSVNGTTTQGTPLTTLTETNGWDTWETVSVSGVSITASDTVIVGIAVQYSGSSGWVYIDNATLTIS